MRRRTRLTFAHWLVDRNSPTTARAIVNRIWQAYFGTGIGRDQRGFRHAERAAVASGTAGLAGGRVHGSRLEPEAHAPADRDLGDVSAIVARDAGAATQRDPDNRLLARGPRFRVDAEIVRDIALAASGLLNPTGRRAERVSARAGVPVPAAGQLRPEDLERGHGRRSLSARALHVPLSLRAVSDAADFRRAQRRCVVCAPRAVEHAAAGADHAERAAVRRGRAGAGATHFAAKAARPMRSGSTYAFRRCAGAHADGAGGGANCSACSTNRSSASPTAGSIRGTWPADKPMQPPTLPQGATPAQLAAWTAVSRVLLNLDETITKE